MYQIKIKKEITHFPLHLLHSMVKEKEDLKEKVKEAKKKLKDDIFFI